MARYGWRTRGMITCFVALLAAAWGLSAFAQENSADAGTNGTASAPANELDPKVDAILSELEAAGARVQTIRTRVEYRVDDNLNLTRTTKEGSILFRRAEPHPMFLVEFDKLNADGTVLKDKEWWLLRDRWLWEAKEKSQTILKREVAAPGEQIDLFDLGKSPVPIPFGQKKAQILENFTVKYLSPQMGDPADSDHLYCKPKEGVPLAQEFRRLEYYVSRKLKLPVKIVAQDAGGERVTQATFALDENNLNVELPESAFRLPEETRKFSVTEEPLKP